MAALQFQKLAEGNRLQACLAHRLAPYGTHGARAMRDEQPMGKIKRPSLQKSVQAVCLVALKFICSKPYYYWCFAEA
jgi:hypothetical protein